MSKIFQKSKKRIINLKNKYFILRHGETIYQTKKKNFLYPADTSQIKLTKKGKEQIKTIAQKLKKAKIDLIYSSDTTRTRQTAQILSKELGVKINFDSRLRDVNLGIYQGRIRKEFYQDFPKISIKRFSKRPFKGENWSDVEKRMINFLKDIDKKYKNKTILIVSHGDPLWLLEGKIKGLEKEELLKQKIEKKTIKVSELRKLNF